MLSIEESDNYIQNDCQQNRKHTGGHNGEVKQTTASFDADVTGQSTQGNSESGSKKHSPTDQDQHNPTNH